jgi:hypothetical protein
MFSQIPNLRIHNFFREIVLVFLTCRNFCLLRQKMLLKLFIFTKRHFAAPLKENKTFLHEINSWIRKLGIRENISRAIYHISFSSSNTQFYKPRISISQFKVVHWHFWVYFDNNSKHIFGKNTQKVNKIFRIHKIGCSMS